MATAVKAKPTTKKPPPPAAKKAPVAAKKTATPKAKFAPAVGDNVTFTGYPAGDEREPVFEVGQTVVVADVNEDPERGTIYTCVADADTLEAFRRAENVDGDELLANEIAAVKVPAVAKEPPPDPHDVLVFKDDAELTELLAQGDPIATADRLFADINKKFYYLGGLLAHIFKERKYVEAGFTDEANGGKTYAGFGAYCKAKFDFGARKGLELIQVYSRYSLIENLDHDKLAKMGYSKAIASARYVTEESVGEILELSKKPILEFKEEIKKFTDEEGRAIGTGSSSRQSSGPRKITLKYEVFSDQATEIEMVIDAASKQYGLTPGQALEHIVSEWAQHFLGEKQKEKIEKAVTKTAKAAGRPVTRPPAKTAA